MSGGGLALPPAGGGVSDQTVAFAAELIDRSGKAPVIEAALAHRTGRPRPLPVRAVLTALVCLALDDRPLFLTDATRLLFCQLPPASRRLLGVPGTATSQRAFLAAYRRVRYCFGAICSVMDPSALPKNRRLTAGRPQGPHQADDPRPGRSCPRPARGVHQRAAGSQHQRPHQRRTRGLRRLHRAGRHPGAAVLPRPVQAHRPVRQRPRRRLVRPRGRPPRARGRQGQAAAEDLPGRWRPPSPPRPGRPARRPRTPISPSAWRWPGPAKTPAAPAPGSWPPSPPAATRPAGSATTVPTPLRYPGDSSCPPAPWATGRSWTTGSTSSASRPIPAAPSWSRAPGTAPPCPGR